MGRLFFPLLLRARDYPTREDGAHFEYSAYREHVARDCQFRCVYCDSHQDEVGGADAMQLDHFRPVSLPEFEHLANDPHNLHYGCARCNLLKSNRWPARGTTQTYSGDHGFVDPFAVDRLEYFKVRSDGQLVPLRPPAAYVVGLLQLQREYLRKTREKRMLTRRLQKQIAAFKSALRADVASGRKSDPRRMMDVLAALERVTALIGGAAALTTSSKSEESDPHGGGRRCGGRSDRKRAKRSADKG